MRREVVNKWKKKWRKKKKGLRLQLCFMQDVRAAACEMLTFQLKCTFSLCLFHMTKCIVVIVPIRSTARQWQNMADEMKLKYILRSTTHARPRWFSQRPELRSRHCCSRVGKTITTLNFMLMSTSRQIALRRKNMTMIATWRIDNHQMSSMWCHHRFHDFSMFSENLASSYVQTCEQWDFSTIFGRV